MSTYNLDDDNLFLRCLNDGEIRIRRITNPGEAVANWEEFEVVNTMNDGLRVDGVVLFGLKLRDLEAELKKYTMYVNRQGYCFVPINYSGGGDAGAGGVHRVNDFFDWSKYGVVPKITAIWNRCQMSANIVVIDYEKKEKDLEDLKLKLKEKDKILDCLNDALELKARDLVYKERCLAEKDEELKEKNDYIEKKDRELSKKERCIALKDQELNDCKSQFEKKERELSILITLWERRLGAFGGSSSCNEGLIDKDKELHLYKMCLEENEHKLRKMGSQLCLEQKRVNDLKFAMSSVANYINHVNANIHKEADYSFLSPAMSYNKHVSVSRDLEDGSTGDEMGARAGADTTQQQSTHGK